MAQRSGKKKVMALGFFDGVHLGHAQLMNMTNQRAAQIGALPAVLTFDRSPMEVVKGVRIPLICNANTREILIKRYFGIDNVIIYHFDKTVMIMHWLEFIESLVMDYSAVHFVVGHDFNCGYRGEGTAQRISDFCKKRGLGCDIIPEFKVDEFTVSSTYIRAIISVGDIVRANRFLGHPYCIYGVVEDGRKVGRDLGTPTINIKPDSDTAVPAFGVYATRVILDGVAKNAVTNVGVKPTFNGGTSATIESYIFDYSGDLYGKTVGIDFYRFLRHEQKFTDAEKLSAQIQADIIKARSILSQISDYFFDFESV